ncbi:MAG TPA: TA system VapC family ribonuclease toxin [Acidobacteriaceae bacterium]|jgi:uncharacterized protein|nr:TA system VapC family ribonuclease toxin [Acidobacteriaceae bacterium]
MRPKVKFLLDVNALVALTDEDHVHHTAALKWFNAAGRHDWGVCPMTEAGFLRVVTRPDVGGRSMEEAGEMLIQLAKLPGFRYWPMTAGWIEVAAPLADRIFGHQQVTDAWLLGLAIRESGVLVTFDRAMRHLAGVDFSRHLLVLG